MKKSNFFKILCSLLIVLLVVIAVVVKIKTADVVINVEYADSMEFTGDPEKDFGGLPHKMEKMLEGKTENICTFGLRWNEENLFIGVKVIDDKLFNDLEVYENDTIEVYLDGGHERTKGRDKNDLQIFFPWGNIGQTEGTTMICNETDDGYVMEMEVPWSLINTTVESDKTLGFDIDCVDNDGSGNRNGVIGFAGTIEDWKNTSKYATIVLAPKEDN